LIRENLPEAVGVASVSDIPDERLLAVAPLYASLPWEQQLRALEPARVSKAGVSARKVIVVSSVSMNLRSGVSRSPTRFLAPQATNIAETSLTIEGVAFVIDGGLVKVSLRFSKHVLRSFANTHAHVLARLD
jgi:HrpA-like RNA helicase